jgi:pimeloyl-ACP methyl ester carboxylesterase
MSSFVRRRRLAALLALLLAPPIAAATTSTPSVAAHPKVPDLSWSDCGDGMQCTRVTVPLDYDRPRGEQITLALARRPATDPAHRVGSLFVNNGGPGNSVLDFMRTDVTGVLSPDLQARFDVIGFDPRGVGESTPVRCFEDADEQQAFFGARLPFPVTPAEVDEFTAGSIEIGERCAARNGHLLEHLSTANVARDMDLLRAAVGDPQLTFAGYSYGGLLGITYANLYPQRVRALVLDGLPDPAQYSAGGSLARREPVTTRVDSATATEAALGFFLDRCHAAGPEGCAFADPTDTRGKFEELLRRLDAHPATIETPSGPLTITRAVALHSLRGSLQFPPIWPDVAQLVQAAFNAVGPEAAAAPANAASDGASAEQPPVDAEQYDNQREAFLAVACSDTVNPRRPSAWSAVAASASDRAPHFGADWAWQSQPCATWAARDHDRFTGPYTRTPANPVLFVNATFDAASNYEQAATTAARLPGSRLLTVDGAGHPASFVPNTCLAGAVTRYLVNQALPEPGATCRPDDDPFG